MEHRLTAGNYQFDGMRAVLPLDMGTFSAFDFMHEASARQVCNLYDISATAKSAGRTEVRGLYPALSLYSRNEEVQRRVSVRSSLYRLRYLTIM